MSFAESAVDLKSPAKRTVRRSNVERSAATRQKVIAAAVDCLNDLGYEGTTVILVARKAGVSRGAAQHQFPSKVDLMVATAEFIVAHQATLRQNMWNVLSANLETLSDMVDFSWTLQSHPQNVALLEIMMATRNDSELKLRFQPFFAHMEMVRTSGATVLGKLIGVEQGDSDLTAMVRLHYAAMRGLAIDALVSKDSEGILAAVALLKRYERKIVQDVAARVNGEKKKH